MFVIIFCMESTIWVQFSVAFISSGEPHSHVIGKKKKEKTRAGGEIGMQECCSFHERYGSKERSSYVQPFNFSLWTSTSLTRIDSLLFQMDTRRLTEAFFLRP